MHRSIPTLVALAVAAGCATERAGTPLEVAVNGVATGATAAPALLADPAAEAARARAAGDYHAALLAYRLAEDRAAAADRPRLRLEQARCLRLARNPGAALELLRPLAAGDDLPLAKSALALTGVIHGEQDALIEAEDFLRRALAGDDSWPGYAAALADLGIVLLRQGDARNGLDFLRRSAARAAADGDAAGTAAALRLEAAYCDVCGDGERAEQLRSEALRIAAPPQQE